VPLVLASTHKRRKPHAVKLSIKKPFDFLFFVHLVSYEASLGKGICYNILLPGM
jgi:hypothetical protein